MANVSMTVWQVKQARKDVAAGESIQSWATRHNLNYNPVYMAVRGQTWASITDPPPIPKGDLFERRKRQERICGNCGYSYRVGGTTKRCGACYAHLKRHGVERTVKHLHEWRHTRLSKEKLQELWELYESGLSTEAIAENLPFSTETLRRRFAKAGYKLRGNAGKRQRLTAPLVRQLRERHYNDGVPIYVLAAELKNVRYQSVYDAVTWRYWRAAGGPMPPKDTDREKQPCSVCSMLTAHESGKCRFCR